MNRRLRAFAVVVAATLTAWCGWWWANHTYVSPTAKPVAGVVMQPVVASPDICVEPDGTVVNNCAEELAEGEFVLVAPGQANVQQPVTAPQQEEVEQPAAVAADPGAPGPCVTPPGAIYAPDCAAPPNSAAVGGGPSSGGGGGGGGDPGPAPCATPAGAIYSSC